MNFIVNFYYLIWGRLASLPFYKNIAYGSVDDLISNLPLRILISDVPF